jgi:hypothetical protein
MAPSVQVSRIRSTVSASPPSVQVSRIRAVAGASGGTGASVQVSRIRSTTGSVGSATDVEPFSTVNLGSGTWTQTSGPTVTTPTFVAPAGPDGYTLTFVDGSSTSKTVTVLPQTVLFRDAGVLAGLNTTIAADVATGSGQAMPTAPPSGPWLRQYGQDFTVNIAEGGFNFNANGNLTTTSAAYPYYGNGAIAGQLNGYHDGQPDSSSVGQYYSSRTMSIANSVLTIRRHTEDVGGVPVAMGGHIHPVVPAALRDPLDGWRTQPYGRWSYRIRSDVADRFGGVAVAIGKPWPANGEFDFPEILSGSSSAILGVYHYADTAGGQDGPKTFTGLRTDWHTYTMEWTPGQIRWLLDDVQVYISTDRVAAQPLGFHIQAATTGSLPLTATTGLYQVDWITFDSYTGP